MTRFKGVGPPGQKKYSKAPPHQRVESVDVKRLRTERRGVYLPCDMCCALKDVRPAYVTEDDETEGPTEWS